MSRLRAPSDLFRFPLRTNILLIDSASTPFVGLTQPPFQEYLQIFPRRLKPAGKDIYSCPLSQAEVENT